KEARRGIEIDGPSPANLLMFGTPSKILDGSTVEAQFFELEETGYARRLLTAYSVSVNKIGNLTPEQVFDLACASSSSEVITKLKDKFAALADPLNFNRKIYVPKEVSIHLIAYRQKCEAAAELL